MCASGYAMRGEWRAQVCQLYRMVYLRDLLEKRLAEPYLTPLPLFDSAVTGLGSETFMRVPHTEQ
jgi:hypothetical protein